MRVGIPRICAFVLACTVAQSASAAEKDIVSTAVDAGSFKTLAAALKAAGLVETLQGDGPFTVFAPTDAAFAKLPKGTVEPLLKPENKSKHVSILTYHVVARKVRAADVVKLKGRSVGGRVSVRRSEEGAIFDHGAQDFTVKCQEMLEQVEGWISAGVAATWDARIGSLDAGDWTPASIDTTRYVGVPSMSAIAKQLAIGLDIVLQCRVTKIARDGDRWRLTNQDEYDSGTFDILILNAPGPQSFELIVDFPVLQERLGKPEFTPCWAVMLALKERLPLSWDGAFVNNSPLSWIARNSSKPTRPLEPDCWVLHGSPQWSKEHFNDSSDIVAALLINRFRQDVGLSPRQCSHITAHRWRFALPHVPLEAPFFLDAETRLGACGDWCGGPRVEGAFLSGLRLAEAVRDLY